MWPGDNIRVTRTCAQLAVVPALDFILDFYRFDRFFPFALLTSESLAILLMDQVVRFRLSARRRSPPMYGRKVSDARPFFRTKSTDASNGRVNDFVCLSSVECLQQKKRKSRRNLCVTLKHRLQQ